MTGRRGNGQLGIESWSLTNGTGERYRRNGVGARGRWPWRREGRRPWWRRSRACRAGRTGQSGEPAARWPGRPPVGGRPELVGMAARNRDRPTGPRPVGPGLAHAPGSRGTSVRRSDAPSSTASSAVGRRPAPISTTRTVPATEPCSAPGWRRRRRRARHGDRAAVRRCHGRCRRPRVPECRAGLPRRVRRLGGLRARGSRGSGRACARGRGLGDGRPEARSGRWGRRSPRVPGWRR